jgi:hypothetical protein
MQNHRYTRSGSTISLIYIERRLLGRREHELRVGPILAISTIDLMQGSSAIVPKRKLQQHSIDRTSRGKS